MAQTMSDTDTAEDIRKDACSPKSDEMTDNEEFDSLSDSECLDPMTNVKLPPLTTPRTRSTKLRRDSKRSSVTKETMSQEEKQETPLEGKSEPRNLSRASFKSPQNLRKSSVILEENKTTFDPCDPYNFDSEEEDNETRTEHSSTLQDHCTTLYRTACKQAGIIPVKRVLQQFGQSLFTVRDLDLSPCELKAIFKTLASDTKLTELDLSGNRLSVKEINYICQILTLNKTLTTLNLNSCRLCGKPISALSDFLSKSHTLRRLYLSDNDFGDSDAIPITNIIRHNESIGELNLSHNRLGDSAILIGNAIKDNEAMTTIDLSWNHIRGYGAVGMAKGLAHNTKLTTVILAWNGFGFEGCSALGQSLICNNTIQSLDLSCNRIHPPALFELIKGLEKNKSISRLRLAFNPITAPMTTILLNRILHAKENNLKELDIEGVVVCNDFLDTLKELQKRRFFIVRHDLALPLNKSQLYMAYPKNIYNIDPIRILYFMKEHMRTIDLFLKIDKDNSNTLTRDEMQYAFEVEGFPISSAALDSVMSYLDTNKDGKIDLLIPTMDAQCERLEELYPGTYREFIEGERKLKRKLIKQREEEAAEIAKCETPGSKLSSKEKMMFSKTFERKTPPRLGLPKIK